MPLPLNLLLLACILMQRTECAPRLLRNRHGPEVNGEINFCTKPMYATMSASWIGQRCQGPSA